MHCFFLKIALVLNSVLLLIGRGGGDFWRSNAARHIRNFSLVNI
jgi:hypothetical protein